MVLARHRDVAGEGGGPALAEESVLPAELVRLVAADRGHDRGARRRRQERRRYAPRALRVEPQVTLQEFDVGEGREIVDAADRQAALPQVLRQARIERG